MLKVQIDIDAEKLKEIAKQFSKNMTEAAFPNTANAMQQAQHMIRQSWTDYLSGETSLDGIENLEKVNRSMIESVKERKNRDFDYSVYSDSKQLERIAEGSPEVKYDMKKTHPYGRKSRVSKKGVPYLIIPFRWGTPNGKGTKRRWNNFIPQKEYDTKVLPLEMSSTTGLTHPEANAKGQAIDRQEYNWGGRKKDMDDDRMNGMVRMKDVQGSTYFTFRVISAKSPANSWWYHRDAQKAVDIMGALQRTHEQKIRSMIEQGVKNDEEMYNKDRK